MKNKTTAGILAIIFGAFGVHRFYLGQTFLGILYLVLMPFAAVLGLIDGIILLTMPEEVFDVKYNDARLVDRRADRRANRRAKKEERRDRRRGNHRSTSRVKPRHQVQTTRSTKPSRTNTDRSKKKIAFKKAHAEGQVHFKDYQFAEAETAYLKALSIVPDYPPLLFDLACLYSMKEDAIKGFEYLELAVHKGFKNLDDIENNPSLAYLRIQDEFLDFVKTGYKRVPTKKEELGVELLEQLRQLDILKSRGLLTELEFEQEREKLMR